MASPSRPRRNGSFKSLHYPLLARRKIWGHARCYRYMFGCLVAWQIRFPTLKQERRALRSGTRQQLAHVVRLRGLWGYCLGGGCTAHCVLSPAPITETGPGSPKTPSHYNGLLVQSGCSLRFAVEFRQQFLPAIGPSSFWADIRSMYIATPPGHQSVATHACF